MASSADRLQPYIVAQHRKSSGMAGVTLDPQEAMADAELLAYAREEITRLKVSSPKRGALAEHDHESKIRCQALERMVATYEANHP